MSLHYTHEKLDAAIQTLATNPDKIQSRLYGAWLQMQTLRTETHNLTQSMQDKFATIEKRLTLTTISEKEGNVQASIGNMTNEEASEIAKDILSLYREVFSVYEGDGYH